MRQVEMSRTLVFNAPRPARSFAEATVRDDLGLGPARRGEADLHRQERAAWPQAQASELLDPGSHPRGRRDRRRHLQALPDRAIPHGRTDWRIECAINSPDDIGVQRWLHNLPELIGRCRDASRRTFDVHQSGQGCALPNDGLRLAVLSSKPGHCVADPLFDTDRPTRSLRFHGSPTAIGRCIARLTDAGLTITA